MNKDQLSTLAKYYEGREDILKEALSHIQDHETRLRIIRMKSRARVRKLSLQAIQKGREIGEHDKALLLKLYRIYLYP